MELVIGGKGFIGSAVMRRLSDPVSYDLVDGQDVLDVQMLDKYVSQADVVFDCAGILGSAETFGYMMETVDANVHGALRVLDACRRNGVPMVFMSLKNTWLNPYMITKHAATKFCQMYYEYFDLPTCVVRGLNGYGPGQHWGKVRKLVPTLIVQAFQNQPITLYGDGKQIVDLIYVDDLAEVMVRMWRRERWGEVIDAGTGIPLQVVEVARKIVSMTNSASTIQFAPMRLGEPPRAVALADPAPAKQLLDYYPETSLEDGLQQTIEWYHEHWREVER